MSLPDAPSIARAFDDVAPGYDQAAVLPREIERRLLDKLDYLPLQPQLIIDVGTGTGHAAAELADRFPSAQVQLVDLSAGMLAVAEHRMAGYGERCQLLSVDAQALPQSNGSVDFVFCNLMLPWCPNVPAVLDEFRRVLKPDGLLLFSALGPDTLYELRASWAQVDRLVHVDTFVDMHTIGDELLRAGFADPVMDVERLTVTYRGVDHLQRELKAVGARNFNRQRRRTLTGKRRWQRMMEVYRSNFSEADRIWASFEVIYGHARGPQPGQPRRTGEGLVAEFSLDQLRGSRRDAGGNDD